MRSLILKVLNLLAQRRMRRLPNVSIAKSAKVNFRGIRGSFSSLSIGEGSIVEAALVADRSGASIHIGSNTFIGESVIISAERIEIGDDVLISWGCSIVDHDSHALDWDQRRNDVRRWYKGEKDWDKIKIGAIKIADRSWLGFNCIVLKGATVGEGAVVGAGSVVTKDVMPYTLVAGNPARLIRDLPPAMRPS